MAHRLLSDRSSKCATPHGHNEFVRIKIATPDQDYDWGGKNAANRFEDIKTPWHGFVDGALDHAFQLGADDPLIGYFTAHEPDLLARLLIIKGDPTTEALAVALFQKCTAILCHHKPSLKLLSLELEETPTNCVMIEASEHLLSIDLGDWCHRPDHTINDLSPKAP